MIIMKNGTVYNETTLAVVRSGMYNGFSAIIKKSEGVYEEVVLRSEWSSGYLEPIYSEDYAKEWIVDATDQDYVDYANYLFKNKMENKIPYCPCKSMLVEVVKGRKYKKGIQFIIDKVTDYVVPGTYGRVSVTYIDGIDADGNRIHIDSTNTVYKGMGKMEPIPFIKWYHKM